MDNVNWSMLGYRRITNELSSSFTSLIVDTMRDYICFNIQRKLGLFISKLSLVSDYSLDLINEFNIVLYMNFFPLSVTYLIGLGLFTLDQNFS